MLKIRILQNTVAALKTVRKGDVIEINKVDAKYLIAIKKAELVVDVPHVAAPIVEEPIVEPVDAREPTKKRNKK